MYTNPQHKLYLGFGGCRVRIPSVLSNIGVKQGAKSVGKNAALLSKEERKVHHFLVKKMAVAENPITADLIADELELSHDRVDEITHKLERLKTFIYRSDGQGINWAYPLSLEDTGIRMTASSGEQFFAAWGFDAFAAPFVYGRLQSKKLSFTLQSKCANSGRKIEISLDSDLNITKVPEGSDPMLCVALVPLVKTKRPSIVDIFWRKSVLFWSEEDVKEYSKRERDLRLYMNLSKEAIASVKKMQSSVFGFDMRINR